MNSLEKYFEEFRKNTIGEDLKFTTPFGIKKMIYGDWIASGRLYRPIEKIISETVGPYLGNTHTETSETGTLMTKAYHYAQKVIKDHVNAGPQDVIITTGFGMTAAIVKFQRILGMKTCGMLQNKDCLNEIEKPVVFVTHMEHHSNHTSWYETIADVVQIPPGKDMLIDLEELRTLLHIYRNRKVKIGAFTACSNVTGIITPYHEMAAIMHEHGGVCFVDFAASAPYSDIDMHPGDPKKKLDAIFFSPHKFLGGPGSSGVLIFDSSLYKNLAPDQPGGGTVDWTNPWGEFKYIDDIEAREDGGTPGFLQAMRTALAIRLKEKMTTKKIREREKELVALAFRELRKIPRLFILANNTEDRLGVFSFYIDGLHFNLVSKLLNDKFGIQVRGGCACAGTYGHYLLNVSYEDSHTITSLISSGDLSRKPGWIRLSLHPTMTGNDLVSIAAALEQISRNGESWSKDYIHNKYSNEFRHKEEPEDKTAKVSGWFDL
ncbi:MAG: aminotransferase class V-fold PLP-dependent enzyme [Bacteroidales bacterium]